MAGNVGRPRLIESPQKFDELVDSYLELCRTTDPKEPVTLNGLVLALGLTHKDSFYEYEKYEGFSDSVKRARTFIELEYEKKLVNGQNAAGPIFALKNFGWKDKTEVAATVDMSFHEVLNKARERAGT